MVFAMLHARCCMHACNNALGLKRFVAGYDAASHIKYIELASEKRYLTVPVCVAVAVGWVGCCTFLF